MKIERYENETDEDWAERLAYETGIANDTETTIYFVEDDPDQEDSFIINYVGKDSMTWKEHPEGPFTCKQVLEWKNKADAMLGFRKAAEDFGGYAADLNDKLDTVRDKVAEWDSIHMRDRHAAPSILSDLENILEAGK